MTTAQVLELVDIFEDLNAEQLARIFQLCIEQSYQKDEIVFEERSPSKAIYVILEGEVEILVNTSPRQEAFDEIPRRIALLDMGQSFGEIALVDQGLRSATARCASPACRLLEIDRDHFMQLLQDDVAMGFIVMSNLAADLCLKIRQTNFRVRDALLYHGSLEEH